MDYKDIQKNIDNIKIGNINVNKENITIPILYDKNDLSIKVPEIKNKYEYFRLHQFNNDFFNNYLTLQLMEDMDEFEEEYKNDIEFILNQKDAINFSDFIVELKNKIIKKFFNEIKTDKNYLSMINFNDLNLENHEIDRAIWNENVDFSYIPEIKKIDEKHIIDAEYDEDNDDNDEIEVILRNRFHVNKNTKKEKGFILKCNIIFINKKLDNKKHIYINWIVI
jgi:hypothetical protein